VVKLADILSIYAIGDLHFSGEPPTKPMEIFGENWAGHRSRIIANWQNTVTDADTVILCYVPGATPGHRLSPGGLRLRKFRAV